MKFIRKGQSGALRRMLVLGAVLACPAQHALAVVKCVDGEGRVTFQDVLCDNASTSVPLKPSPVKASADAPSARGKVSLPATMTSTSAKTVALR